MIGNAFAAGVIGCVALKVLMTVGKLSSEYPDYWAVNIGHVQMEGAC